MVVPKANIDTIVTLKNEETAFAAVRPRLHSQIVDARSAPYYSDIPDLGPPHSIIAINHFSIVAVHENKLMRQQLCLRRLVGCPGLQHKLLSCRQLIIRSDSD